MTLTRTTSSAAYPLAEMKLRDGKTRMECGRAGGLLTMPAAAAGDAMLASSAVVDSMETAAVAARARTRPRCCVMRRTSWGCRKRAGTRQAAKPQPAGSPELDEAQSLQD